MRDRFGLGWRPELAGGILSNLDRIDVVELIADDLFDASRRQLRPFKTLRAQVPVVLHGVSLGLASACEVEVARLEKLARVVEALEPEAWSEHLAFVRAAGMEIGHLAAPPRTSATIEGTARNVEQAKRIVGSLPALENIATLIEPPGSDLDEATWLARTVDAAGCALLLDLNNVYVNAVNFGVEPLEMICRLPLERVRQIHLAGGRWISASSGVRRLLDDHRHDVPAEVFALLSEVGARIAQPVTVILERDGSYPDFEVLLAQLEEARVALARGRARAVSWSAVPGESAALPAPQPRALEAFLTRLYVDAEARRSFLSDPCREARLAGLGPSLEATLASLDLVGLELAAASFARKRALHHHEVDLEAEPHRR